MSEEKDPKPSAILAIKKGMKRIFAGETEIPCTEIFVPDNFVVDVLEKDKNGYDAMKVAIKGSKINKPISGILKKSKLSELGGIRIIKEIKGRYSFRKGDRISAKDFFEGRQIVSVSGISKGKGFASVRKRWNFSGGPKSHGQSNKYNSPGSIGASSYPSRVIPGMKMAGHKGAGKVTVKNLKVIESDFASGRIYLKGTVPGSCGSVILVRAS
ncbi:MAG: 50S ribosomal protein L3 [Elusimicrobia bacterium]|nr:50S ribosomal protein L3 [Elusimicrobiota bacterium]